MNGRHIRLLLCICSLSLNSAWAGPVSLDADQIGALRQLVKKDQEAADLYGSLYKRANAALDHVPNPSSLLVGEGRLNSNSGKIKSDRSLQDMQKISALAWVWLVSGDEKYASKGEDFILAWAKVNRGDGDPINETKLEPLIVAYDILRQRFAPKDASIVDGWLRERAIVLWNDPRHRTGNWQSHRLKTVGLIATVLKDDALWKTVEKGFEKQIDSSFKANGESVDFVQRDALHYHLYSISPLLTLACVAHQRGHDWYDYRAESGASLKQAVDFVKPFAFGTEKHLEFADSTVAFDKKRADAGQSEYAPHMWNTCDAGPVFSQASCVDPSAEAIAVKVWCGKPHKKFVDWQSVLNSIKISK